MTDQTEDGFYPDPNDPSRFYRMVNGTRFDFQCGPGTFYHPELMTCVHPWQMPPGSLEQLPPEAFADPES
jgi:hypothetical protein